MRTMNQIVKGQTYLAIACAIAGYSFHPCFFGVAVGIFTCLSYCSYKGYIHEQKDT